jgi:hypothetical protein
MSLSKTTLEFGRRPTSTAESAAAPNKTPPPAAHPLPAPLNPIYSSSDPPSFSTVSPHRPVPVPHTTTISTTPPGSRYLTTRTRSWGWVVKDAKRSEGEGPDPPQTALQSQTTGAVPGPALTQTPTHPPTTPATWPRHPKGLRRVLRPAPRSTRAHAAPHHRPPDASWRRCLHRPSNKCVASPRPTAILTTCLPLMLECGTTPFGQCTTQATCGGGRAPGRCDLTECGESRRCRSAVRERYRGFHIDGHWWSVERFDSREVERC